MGRFEFTNPDLLGTKEQQNVNPVSAFFKRQAAKFDLFQMVPMITLILIGVLFVYGTGQQVGGVHAQIFWKRQLIYAAIGLSVWLSLTFIDYRVFGIASLVVYPVSLLLLVYVLFAGVVRFKARRWIDVAGISVQPSEFGKLALILLIAWLATRKRININDPVHLAAILALTAVPFLLICLEPDLGTSIVLIPVVFSILFISGLHWKYILSAFIAAVALIPTLFVFLKPYQKARIMTFLEPERDPLNLGWNAMQAELTVGSGGFTGKGFMNGQHCLLGYLPKTVANSDFIFPVIAEETGFLGSLLLLILYGILLFSIFRTALVAHDKFGRALCVGIGTLLATHIVINIGMCIRLMPITGLPLPLLSYGGTFLLAVMIYLGIVQSVYAHRDRETPLLDE